MPDFTHEELEQARLKLTRALHATLTEADENMRFARACCRSLEMAAIGDEYAAMIAVRCTCGLVFLKVRCPVESHVAHCPKCCSPVALLDVAACDTVPTEHCGYDGNAIPEPDPRQMTMEVV